MYYLAFIFNNAFIFILLSFILHRHRQPHAASRKPDFVWALKDINFEVKQGEVLGIIDNKVAE